MKRSNIWSVLGLWLGLAAMPVLAAVCTVGERFQTEWRGRLYDTQVLQVSADGNRCFITYIGWGSEWNEWVGEARIHKSGPPVLPQESGVVRESGTARESGVARESGTARESGVARESGMARESGTARRESGAASAGPIRVGDPVMVLWNKTWYPASVLAVGKGKYQIHYDGYADSWDEWVGPNRIRRR
ncbi:Tudor-knot domain-containing protein [Parachitinimonas caeni]|uniref:Tudor-knot domain-containing protein n=1 Tax=Parachitinimonas caeni TaxID=3031301 RepID=A0ABT7E3E7_9NEIS|nr:Tudor-knot domain-containing protein [Parachitinimonas caeni]MDK2126847.1 Tudor-knot domain-containing protein [Parachitinimonas caeni]